MEEWSDWIGYKYPTCSSNHLHYSSSSIFYQRSSDKKTLGKRGARNIAPLFFYLFLYIYTKAALMRRTPFATASSLRILNVPSVPVCVTCGPPQNSLLTA